MSDTMQIMQTRILVSSFPEKIDDYISNVIKEHSVTPHNIFVIEPLGKEFSIQQIRDIKNEVVYKAFEPRLYVLKRFDTASYEAQNAFLKTLEQPPAGVWFILVVTNQFSLLPTVQSRASVHLLAEALPATKSTEALDTSLTSLIERADLSVLTGSALSPKSHNDPLDLFDEIITFFRQRLATDPKSPHILRVSIALRSYVEHNHGDAQNGIDQICLSIYKSYSRRT